MNLENISINIPILLIIYLSMISASYIIYALLRDRIPNKVKYFILSRSFIILLATFLGGFFILDTDLKQALFAFSGVYLGFWLNEQVKYQEERRKIKFFLGLIWQELRYNRVILETLKENYRFFMDHPDNLEIMFLKFSSINTHSGFLKSTVFDAFISSSVITGLKKDETFNELATAYTNIRFLQTALGIVLSDFEIKLKVHNFSLQKNGKDEYVDQILKDLAKKIKNNAGKELAISFRSVSKAIDSVDSYLNTLTVKSSEEEKSDAILINEDKEFIREILQKSPEILPKDLFNDETN